GRVLCEEFGRTALPGQNIDLFQRKFHTFFRREDTNPTRVWSQCMIVKLHRTRHFSSSKTPSDDSIRVRRQVNEGRDLHRCWSAPHWVDTGQAARLTIRRACSCSNLAGLRYLSAEWSRLLL